MRTIRSTRAEGAGDGRKGDALLQEVLSARRIEQRLHVGENRPQCVLDIVSCNRDSH